MRVTFSVVAVLAPFRRGRCNLAAGHPVDHVVRTNHLEVDVAPCCMDQMISADGREVPVPADHHHAEIGVEELDSGGKRQRSP